MADDVMLRDALALAPADTLREAGFLVVDGETDCTHPSAEWRARIDAWIAAARQRKAIDALSDLTRDDVKALLEVLK